MMEVVASGGGGGAAGPFTRHNVQEWSRLDQLTGLLEHARVETDHWTASTNNSSHHFGKVVDSRSRNLADGGQEQRHQTKQLEVFQANIPGGSLQVIRSSTSSSWQSHKILSGGSGWTGSDRLALPSSDSQDFDHLKLTLNPLDLSSQKTKASVGRSGSIGSRRPPSRPRSIVGVRTEEVSEQTDGRRLSELSNICHKVHKEAKQELDRQSPHTLSNGYSCDQNDNITNDEVQKPHSIEIQRSFTNNLINEVTKSSSDSTILSNHLSLLRKKSCSSEDLHKEGGESNESDSATSDWRRSSKVRRSLQFPQKPNSTHKEAIFIPVTKSVSEIKKEIEARKQIVTNSFRSNQWSNFAELEGVLGVVGKGNQEDQSKDSSNSSEVGAISPSKQETKKRQTFITVESLKEVRGRLRKLNSPVDEIVRNDDVDDGIVTEVKPLSPKSQIIDDTPKNSVKSYVFGMEVMLRKTKPPIIGTGSLESRSSNKSLTNGNSRTEEWYNRRKSYGFEQVSNQQNHYSSFEKSKVESSTDSGICRSSDTFPSWQKSTENQTTNPIKTTHNIIIKSYLDADTKKTGEIEGGAVVHKGRRTVVNLTSNAGNSSWNWSSKNEELATSKEEKKEAKGKIADAIRSLREKSSFENQRLSEPITISIPIQQSTKSSHTDPTNLLLKQTKSRGINDKVEPAEETSQNNITPYSELLYGKETEEPTTVENSSTLFHNIPWRGNRTKTLSNFFDSEFKRHSIAVDQGKYLMTKKPFGSYYFNGDNDADNKEQDCESQKHAILPCTQSEKDSNKSSADSDHELSAHEKKQKKVEFCKTEVHFAAEPGRFNIVETDGKPPPSNMFRRRKKTTSDAPNRSGLPEIRFGDTQYEKTLLSVTDNSSTEETLSTKTLAFGNSPVFNDNEKSDNIIITHSNTTIVPARQSNKITAQPHEFIKYPQDVHNNSEDDAPKPRSILKNNIPKPKPYLLGEAPENHRIEDSVSWGVKLKSVKSDEESPKVQLDSNLPKETEFQKLLKSLRPATSRPPDLLELPTQSKQSSTAADNGLEVRISSSTFPPDNRRASWSVADRIRHVEEARGYSTKVNFGPQETTVVDTAKADTSTFHSESLKNSWQIKEQDSSYHSKPAENPELCFKSPKRLTHSQSFTIPGRQSPPDETGDDFNRNVLKSTSLVLEVQNPNLSHVGEFEKKSVREISTNLIRDNCAKNNQRIRDPSIKNRSISEKINQYSQRTENKIEVKKKLPEFNTKTIPPVRKTSSSTQTYFVNRSSIKKDLSRGTSIKINTVYQEKPKAFEVVKEEINGIPDVLVALDDLSRCIDEVIIESPQKICQTESSNPNIFKVKEDFKKERESIGKINCSETNVMNQLDLLRELAESAELSEDSLKADEEVRAYMSTDNDDDNRSERSGSWSRARTLRQDNRQATAQDMIPRMSPSFGPSASYRSGHETAVIPAEAPRVTSICLQYDDVRQPTTALVRPQPSGHSTHHVENKQPSYVSRNILNTDSSGITSKVEFSMNGDRTWSFSKVQTKETLPSKVSESNNMGIPSHRPSDKKGNNTLLVRDTSLSPSRFSINSQSPSKESLFLERSAERNTFYNENNRQTSSSPISRKVTSSVNLNLDAMASNLRRSDQINHSTKSFSNQTSKTISQISAANVPKAKLEDKIESVKKCETKKPTSEVKTKERKLSTSSSGRDGWLNTPKEVQVRKKSEPAMRKQEVKKETKTSERSSRVVNGVKLNQRRTESPIYQNREVYAERRDSNDNTETESTILEELTKAADQILLAVNGYTDDDSFRASSEDEYRKRRERNTSQPLCTISELPTKKTNPNKSTSRQNMGVIKSTRSSDLRKEYRSSSKTRVTKTSSNSSMDSGPTTDVKPLLSPEDRSKRRAARLLQRASSRELLFQTAASSSEDIGSGSDTGSLRIKRVYRRPRLQNGKLGGSKQDLSSNTNESRTKERVQRTAVTGEIHKSQRTKAQSENKCCKHSKTTTGSSTAGERRERRPATVVTHSSRTQKKNPETSQSEARVTV